MNQKVEGRIPRVCGVLVSLSPRLSFVLVSIAEEQILHKEGVMSSIGFIDQSPVDGSRFYPIPRVSNFC
jgi:hypothetical protein